MGQATWEPSEVKGTPSAQLIYLEMPLCLRLSQEGRVTHLLRCGSFLGQSQGNSPPLPRLLWTLSPVHLGLHPGNYGDSQLGAHYVSGTMSVIMWISQISSYPHFLFFKLNFKFYLLLTALSLRSFLWAFSSCSDCGATLLCGMWASHCGGLSCCRAWALGTWVSIQLWLTGLVAPWHVRSSQTRNRTCVPCIGRWVPIHQGSISPYPHFLEK